MKKFILIIILTTLTASFTSNIYAEEIRSRFGFYLTVPPNFYVLQNKNVDDFLKKYKDSEFDKDAFSDMIAGVSKQNLKVDIFYPTRVRNPENHSINVNAQKGDIKEITSSFSMKELCPPYKEEYSKIFKKNIKQYSCELTNKFSPKFDPAIFLYHDGLSGYLVQYQIQTGAGFTTFTAACDSYKTCTLMKNWMSQMIESIREPS